METYRNYTGARRSPAGLEEVASPLPLDSIEEDSASYDADLDSTHRPDPTVTTSDATDGGVAVLCSETTRSLAETQSQYSANRGLTDAVAPPPVPFYEEEGVFWRVETGRRSLQSIDLPIQSHTSEDGHLEKEAGVHVHEQVSNKQSEFLAQLYTVSYLILFSLFGTLARLGVDWLNTYPGSPVATPAVWANVGGSFVLGFLLEDRKLFRSNAYLDPEEEHLHRKRASLDASQRQLIAKAKVSPLYIGLATGFCGSFTSFSAFQRDVFIALSNADSGASRSWGFSFEATLTVLILTTMLSIGALRAGAHLSLFLEPWTPTFPPRIMRNIIAPLGVFLAWGCWAGAVVLAVVPPQNKWRGEVAFALVFAPIGCLLRFLASLKLNTILPSFPLGTFVVNVFGCAILAMCYDLQRTSEIIGGTTVGCQLLEGVMDGFCGCLTTVSTWVAELSSMRRRHAYIYGICSLAAGLAMMVAIMGSVKWTLGWNPPACTT